MADIVKIPTRAKVLIMAKLDFSGTVKTALDVGVVREIRARSTVEGVGVNVSKTTSASDGTFTLTANGKAGDKYTLHMYGIDGENDKVFRGVTGTQNNRYA